MRALVQRVSHASVTIDGRLHGQIGQGFLVLLGITDGDTVDDAVYLADKFELSGGQIENVARKKTIQSILSGNEPAIEDLIKYCCEEEIGAKKERRRIGF